MCIDNYRRNDERTLNLTIGKYYDLTPSLVNILYDVVDDSGNIIPVRAGRFKSQRTIRSEKLRQLGI